MNKNILNNNFYLPLVDKNSTSFFSSKFEPLITYNNSLLNKFNILTDNKGKSAIYRWVHKKSGKSYVGSSVNLYYRLLNYYNTNYLNKRILISNSRIYRALLSHGYENFNLEILEYCDKKIIIEREQYYIDLYKPEYNILTRAGSSLGFKHSPETLLKFKNRKLSPEALTKLKKSKVGVIPSNLAKLNQLLATGHPVKIINKENNSVKEYKSVRAAARDIGVNHATILNYINSNKLLKDIYIVYYNT